MGIKYFEAKTRHHKCQLRHFIVFISVFYLLISFFFSNRYLLGVIITLGRWDLDQQLISQSLEESLAAYRIKQL